MTRFSANLGFMFGEHAFLDRFDAAARAGFKAVEFPSPYAHDADDVAKAARDAAVQVVLINLPAGDEDKGDVGLTGVPGREADYAETLGLALTYAAALDCPRLHTMAGIVPDGLRDDDCMGVFADNLAKACTAAGEQGRDIMIEPINRLDVPGYILSYQDQARELIEAVRAPNLKLQFDVYHCQIMQGDLARNFERLLPLIGHVQISDNPGRHEPGTGEINYRYLIPEFARLGYDGWIGCEYVPQTDTESGLGWMTAF